MMPTAPDLRYEQLLEGRKAAVYDRGRGGNNTVPHHTYEQLVIGWLAA